MFTSSVRFSVLHRWGTEKKKTADSPCTWRRLQPSLIQFTKFSKTKQCFVFTRRGLSFFFSFKYPQRNRHVSPAKFRESRRSSMNAKQSNLFLSLEWSSFVQNNTIYWNNQRKPSLMQLLLLVRWKKQTKWYWQNVVWIDMVSASLLFTEK